MSGSGVVVATIISVVLILLTFCVVYSVLQGYVELLVKLIHGTEIATCRPQLTLLQCNVTNSTVLLYLVNVGCVYTLTQLNSSQLIVLTDNNTTPIVMTCVSLYSLNNTVIVKFQSIDNPTVKAELEVYSSTVNKYTWDIGEKAILNITGITGTIIYVYFVDDKGLSAEVVCNSTSTSG